MISERIPPTSPTVCRNESFSLNNKTDISEDSTILLPLIAGKNNWLGKIPDSFRLIEFIANVHPPQIKPIPILLLSKTEALNFPLFLSRQNIAAQINATNKNPELSSLCAEA